MGLMSAQIIARSQTEIAAKTDELTNSVVPSKLKYITITPFGSNLFAILVTWDNTALPTTTYVHKTAVLFKVTFDKLFNKTLTFKPKIGLALLMFYNAHVLNNFIKAEEALLGLSSVLSSLQTKIPKPRVGLKSAMSFLYKDLAKTLSPLFGLKLAFSWVFTERAKFYRPLLGLNVRLLMRPKPLRVKPLLGMVSDVGYVKTGG
jgi:hypothetical protein